MQHTKLSSISSNPSALHNSCKLTYRYNSIGIRTATHLKRLEFRGSAEV
jgi:hypothetical protein